MANRGVVEDTYTLVVPTYNRPAELGRLLRYLARHRVAFRILVLDSSEPEIQRANRSAAGGVNANIDFESFDPSTLPWDKFRRGSELVRSPYCSLCADDDVVLPDSLEPIVEFLEAHRDHAVAHGWYFFFHDGPQIGITGSAYSGASIDAEDPLQRLYALFRNYEALTYGVYRADTMRRVLGEVKGVDSMLGKELLGGALSAVHGKARRLPVFYYGRSHTPSHPYVHWHPLDFLSSAPDELYRDYAAYRRILLRAFEAVAYDRYAQDELTTLIDLIHFRYLSEYLKPHAIEYLIEHVMAHSAPADMMRGLWPVLAADTSPAGVSRLAAKGWLTRAVRGAIRRLSRNRGSRLSADEAHRMVQSRRVDGCVREYRIYKEFLSSVSGHKELEAAIPRVLDALDCYE